MSIGKLILGAIAGFAAGVIAGMLFAPEKGADTRKRILNMGDAYVKQIKIRLDEPMKAIAEICNGIVHLTEAINKGKDMNEEPINRV